MAPVEATGRADFLRMIEMNALSCFLCCRAAVGLMRGSGLGGRIVNVAARPALEPRKGARMLAYAAAKAAVATLTQALAEEVKEDIDNLDFAGRRELIENLGIWGELSWENEQRVLYIIWHTHTFRKVLTVSRSI